MHYFCRMLSFLIERICSLFLVFRSGPTHRNNENNRYTNSRLCSKIAQSRCEYSDSSVDFPCLNFPLNHAQFLDRPRCYILITDIETPDGPSLPWHDLCAHNSYWRWNNRKLSEHYLNIRIPVCPINSWADTWQLLL